MCVYSMIVQDRIDKWRDYINPLIPNTIPNTYPGDYIKIPSNEELKKEIEELKRLLKKAKIYDEETNQKDCENDDKKRILKEIAEKLGVEIEFP